MATNWSTKIILKTEIKTNEIYVACFFLKVIKMTKAQNYYKVNIKMKTKNVKIKAN